GGGRVGAVGGARLEAAGRGGGGGAEKDHTTRWVCRVRGRGGDGARRSLVLLVVAQRFSLELDLVAAVRDAVEDRVGECGVVEGGGPGLHRPPACDQGRA